MTNFIMTESEFPVIRWDALKDSQYPNGAWYCTVDDPDNTYNRFYGETPNEAFDNWRKSK